MQHELLVFQRHTQPGFELQTLDGLFVHLLGKEAMRVAPGFLGVIHRRISLLQEQVEILAIIGKERHTDRERRRQEMPFDLERLGHALMDLVGHTGNGIAVAHVAEQDDEFVAALAADRIRFAHADFQARHHVLKQDVADRVPQRIVDCLEAVKVEIHHGHPTVHAAGQRLYPPEAVT